FSVPCVPSCRVGFILLHFPDVARPTDVRVYRLDLPRGKSITKVVPFPRPSLRARIVSACISTMALLIARPSPRPSLRESAFSKAPKTLPTNCGSMPMPLSLISMVILLGLGLYDRTETVPFSGVNLHALCNTLQKTCCKRGASATNSCHEASRATNRGIDLLPNLPPLRFQIGRA